MSEQACKEIFDEIEIKDHMLLKKKEGKLEGLIDNARNSNLKIEETEGMLRDRTPSLCREEIEIFNNRYMMKFMNRKENMVFSVHVTREDLNKPKELPLLSKEGIKRVSHVQDKRRFMEPNTSFLEIYEDQDRIF